MFFYRPVFPSIMGNVGIEYENDTQISLKSQFVLYVILFYYFVNINVLFIVIDF